MEVSALPVEQNFEEVANPGYFLLILRPAHVISSSQQVSPRQKLTNKEMEIAEYICKGLTNKEISEKLYISLPTVATHVQHIFQKMEVSNRSRLAHKLLIE